jgi:hypothetical protein
VKFFKYFNVGQLSISFGQKWPGALPLKLVLSLSLTLLQLPLSKLLFTAFATVILIMYAKKERKEHVTLLSGNNARKKKPAASNID